MLQAADLEFVVIRQPVRGRLAHHQGDAILPLIQFDAGDLMKGTVVYEHQAGSTPGAAASMDTFSIMACLSLRGKRSQPRTVHVAIAARNIHPPYLTNHRELNVTTGINDVFCSTHFPVSLADPANGRAYATVLRLSSVLNVLWLNGAS